MFDRIAPRYDLLNRMLSMGTDVRWRRRLTKCLPAGERLELLDLATGTADQAISLVRSDARIKAATGLDLAEQMLAVGRTKIERLGLTGKIRLGTGDAVKIPEPDARFDVATISFGIRNVIDVSAALAEMKRVLKPGGRALILEFSTPASPVFRPIYLFYLRNILPHIGALLSGDRNAYRYLNQTIETFPSGDAFCELMREVGFRNVRHIPLSFGIATIYQGDRPEAS